MKCSNVIVPGMKETSKIKNPGLAVKMEKEMDADKGDTINKASAIRRSSVKMSPTEGGLVLKDTEMTTPLDNFSRGNRDTKQVHNMLSENNILHRINKDGSITAFLEVGNGKHKVIKGLRTFEDVTREIGIPNPYEESLLYP